jgi:hypothetical protein
MKKGREVCDLLLGQRRERWHPSVSSAHFQKIADFLSVLIAQD